MTPMTTSSLSRSSFDDLIHSQNHLGSLVGTDKHLHLALQCFSDLQLHHVSDSAVVHVQPSGAVALIMSSSKFGDQVGAVIASIVSDDCWNCPKRFRKSLNRQRLTKTQKRQKRTFLLSARYLFTRGDFDQLINGFGH
jgi:hypothetical protein